MNRNNASGRRYMQRVKSGLAPRQRVLHVHHLSVTGAARSRTYIREIVVPIVVPPGLKVKVGPLNWKGQSPGAPRLGEELPGDDRIEVKRRIVAKACELHREMDWPEVVKQLQDDGDDVSVRSLRRWRGNPRINPPASIGH